jgi:uncharacterized membrane protein YqaE (UPF0057 family)
MGLIRLFGCLLFPPIMVIHRGLPLFVIVCLLTLLGWIPGAIAAILLNLDEF